MCVCVCVYIHMYLLSCSVMSKSLRPHGLQPARLHCPWDSLGKNTGVGCHSLLQEIFLSWGLNLSLLHCRWILYYLIHQRSPCVCASHSVMSNSVTPRTVACQASLSMEFYRSRILDCHSLVQKIFPTQRLNPGILYHRQILYCLSYNEVLRSLYKYMCVCVCVCVCVIVCFCCRKVK